METETNDKTPNSGGQVDAIVVPRYLLKFCDLESKKLATPFSVNGWTVASSGHIAIRVPAIAGVDREPPFESAESLPWEPRIDGEWINIPAYVLPEKRRCTFCSGRGKAERCPECDGVGEVELSNSYHTYTVGCDTCFGNGFIAGDSALCPRCAGAGTVYASDIFEVELFDRRVNGFLLEKIKDLPGVQVFTKESAGGFNHFRFDGGHGLFMGLRK